MEKKETKICKKCQEEINKKAKKCPKCGSKQGFPKWIIVIVVIILIGIIASSGKDSNNNSNIDSKTDNKTIEYAKISVDELEDALENNAAAAKDTYNKKYLEISGKLGTIDSDLKYISLVSETNEWDIIGIHCNIRNDEQRNIIKTLSKDQPITVKGQITDVGEVLGYYLNITEIEAR